MGGAGDSSVAYQLFPRNRTGEVTRGEGRTNERRGEVSRECGLTPGVVA